MTGKRPEAKRGKKKVFFWFKGSGGAVVVLRMVKEKGKGQRTDWTCATDQTNKAGRKMKMKGTKEEHRDVMKKKKGTGLKVFFVFFGFGQRKNDDALTDMEVDGEGGSQDL